MDNLARLLKESWMLVEEDQDRLGEHFHARMFQLDPGLRSLFPVQLNADRSRLLEAIVTAVQTIDDPESFAGYLSSLGRDHRKYQATPEHYRITGEALLDALRAGAGGQWSIEYDQAWREAYTAIAERMVAGADADHDPPFWPAEVLGHERRGADVAVITCRPLEHPFRYRAGQYVSVEVPDHLPRDWRTFSIANAPSDDGVLEFHVRAASSGWVSGAMVRRLRPGDLLRIAAPMGSMVLDPGSTRDVVCAAWGVGLAPVKALVEALTRYNRTRWVHVLFGARTRDDLYGLPELHALAARYPWLSVVPFCSDDPGFDGERGQPDEVLDRYGPWRTHDCYVSGPARMVRTCLRAFAAQGVPSVNVRYDTFGDL